MALLGYKERFVEPLLSGQKIGTIRALRKFPIKEGERLYHYVGLRTKDCFKIGESKCDRVDLIRINFVRGGGDIFVNGSFYAHTKTELDSFAINDGFENWDDMKSFWIETHGVKTKGRIIMPAKAFSGQWIRHTKLLPALGLNVSLYAR